MSDQIIYSSLSTISESEFILNRYISYIKACSNRPRIESEIYEKHHILPKEMFPQYRSFSKFPWNMVLLTPRQHMIAHWILWKMTGSAGQLSAAFLMGNKNVRFPSHKKSHVITEARKARLVATKGKCTYLDSDGNSYWVDTADPRVLSGELIHHQKGRGYYRYADGSSDESLWLSVDDPLVLSGGVVPFNKGLKKSKLGRENIIKGVEKTGTTARDLYGNPLGRIPKSDPRWAAGEIIHASKGYTVCTNGKENLQLPVNDPRILSGEYWSVVKGKVSVVDSDGNKFLASVNDPRYISGELVSTALGYGTYKNSNGETRRLRVDDSLVLSGEFFSVMVGRSVYRDEDGNTICMSVDDPRVASGEFVSTSSGRGSYRDKDGNFLVLPLDDPRVLSGEVVGCTTGIGNYIDHTGTLVRCRKDDPRVLRRELIGIKAIKYDHVDSNGHIESMYVNDPRVLSGEFVRQKTKKPKYIN